MMKKKIEILALVSAFVLGACNNADDNPAKEVLSGIELKNFSNTGCKSYEEVRTRSDEYFMKEAFKYSSIHESCLYVTHENAIFNCCPGELKAEISTEGNCIFISEWSTEDMCDCICQFDLNYEIGPLVEGKTYTIYIGHKGLESKVAEFEFHNAMSGVWETEQ